MSDRLADRDALIEAWRDMHPEQDAVRARRVHRDTSNSQIGARQEARRRGLFDTSSAHDAAARRGRRQ